MSSDAKPRDGDSLTSMQIKVMAIACAFAIATLYYNQPLLALIGASFGTSDSVTSQIVMLSQIGYSLGLFLFVPLGDRHDLDMDRRQAFRIARARIPGHGVAFTRLDQEVLIATRAYRNSCVSQLSCRRMLGGSPEMD